MNEATEQQAERDSGKEEGEGKSSAYKIPALLAAPGCSVAPSQGRKSALANPRALRIERVQMPALANPKHERFAQLVVLGNSDVSAYRKAFKATRNTAESNACRLREIEGVQSRIAELQELAAAKTVMSLAEKRQFLADVVRASPSEIDANSPLCQGIEYVAAGGVRGKLRRGNAESGNEETEPDTTTVRIRIPDKLKCIELDAKLAGELKGDNGTQVSLTVVVSHAQVLDRVRAMSPVLAGLSKTGSN